MRSAEAVPTQDKREAGVAGAGFVGTGQKRSPRAVKGRRL